MALVADLLKVNADVTAIVRRQYGDRLNRIVLFGSYARGDFGEESDVDYLALLDGSASPAEEIYTLSPILNDYFMDTLIPVSVIVVSIDEWLHSTRAFFREVRKDGILIYEREPEPAYS
jgi:uncharacterized protein